MESWLYLQADLLIHFRVELPLPAQRTESESECSQPVHGFRFPLLIRTGAPPSDRPRKANLRSFIAQSLHWIDLGRAARRDITSQKRHSTQQNAYQQEGQRVSWFNLEKKVAHHAS